jgi:O-antigen/teichoic acid export membrane protein
VSGTATAQALPIAMSPILTRLYTPEDFGILALYAAIAAILTTISTAQYEQAITLPAKDEDAANLVSWTLKVCGYFSLFLLITIAFTNSLVAELLGHPEIANWLYLLPFTVFASGVFNAHTLWCNRRSEYSVIAKHSMQLSLVTVACNILLGFSKIPGGQIIGSLIGRMVAALSLRQKTHSLYGSILKTTDKKTEHTLARQYKAHPFYFLPSNIISACALEIPVLMISTLFSITVVGYFSLAHRLVSLPTKLIANAIGDVYRQQISYAYSSQGSFEAIYLKTLKITFLSALLPFTIVYVVAPTAFAFIFGEEWRVAGEFAQILTISSFFSFVSTPLNKGSIVVGAKYYALIWNTLRLVSNLVVWVAALSLKLDIAQLLWGIVIVNIGLYISDAAFQYRFSKLKG